MESSGIANGDESRDPGAVVVPERAAEGIMDVENEVQEDEVAGTLGKGVGPPDMAYTKETKNVPGDGGSPGLEIVSDLLVGHDSDMEVEVGSEEGDDILCDVCKIWRRSYQWKEHLASRCHQRNFKARRREEQWQNEQGRIRGELLEVEDRVASLNLGGARD